MIAINMAIVMFTIDAFALKTEMAILIGLGLIVLSALALGTLNQIYCDIFYSILILFVLGSGVAWIATTVVAANNIHPTAECSNRGICDRRLGICLCYYDYNGLACERTSCPSDCNGNGVCFTENELAEEAGRVYSTPWDSLKHVGCVCDVGYRGYDCSQVECQSGADPLKGFGNAAGRDCSGRGVCNYYNGQCSCFNGFFGTMCQYQVR